MAVSIVTADGANGDAAHGDAAASATAPRTERVPNPAPAAVGVAGETAAPARVAPVTNAPQANATPVAPAVTPAFTAKVGAPAIDRLFEAMCAQKASDLHISTGMAPLVRKDGEIRILDEAAAPLGALDVEQLLDPIMPAKNRDEFQQRHDTDFAYEIIGLGRFRANVFMDRKGRGAVFRVIPSKILTAEDLGLSPHILQLCRLNKGLVLSSSPGRLDRVSRRRSAR
jgi:twitching motility protein PilT